MKSRSVICKNVKNMLKDRSVSAFEFGSESKHFARLVRLLENH